VPRKPAEREFESMKKIEIEILAEGSNCPIVKTPGRKFPGILLQGDSLKVLLDAATEIYEISSHEANDELHAAVGELKDKLAGFVAAYEKAMHANGLELPYAKAISVH
jgi:hypothetical protein